MNQDAASRMLHVNKQHQLSIKRQCELMEIHRSRFYYSPIAESELNLELMRLIDERFMLHPWLGVPRMTEWLRKDMGFVVNHKRIERLYDLLGIQAIGPKPNTSKPGQGHKVYPYLLRNLRVTHSNHVWAMDITYIPVKGGFLYLCAVIDLYSRFVLHWSLGNTMTAEWCQQALESAIAKHGTPEIINTDQGSQFTSDVFTGYVLDDTRHSIKLSMDGKGRAIDNVFIERLWRSVKYEHVYLKPADDGLECYRGLEEYFEYYNNRRRHKSLHGMCPSTFYEHMKKQAA